jgi:hypothetical protein
MLAELAALKLKASESIEMVANSIKEHLVIVLINKDGEDFLNNQFGLKTFMTANWGNGGFVYVRLEYTEPPSTLFD